jgi:Tfp pilus assembly protein PilV
MVSLDIQSKTFPLARPFDSTTGGKRILQIIGKKASSKGFSLIEVLIPILIIAIAIVGLLTSFVMGRVHTAVARHRVLAINVLRAKLEQMKSLGYDALNHYSPNPEVDTNAVLDTGQNEESQEDDLLCTLSTHITDDDGDGALEITVTATWQERVMSSDQTYTEDLHTFVSPTKVSDR